MGLVPHVPTKMDHRLVILTEPPLQCSQSQFLGLRNLSNGMALGSLSNPGKRSTQHLGLDPREVQTVTKRSFEKEAHEDLACSLVVVPIYIYMFNVSKLVGDCKATSSFATMWKRPFATRVHWERAPGRQPHQHGEGRRTPRNASDLGWESWKAPYVMLAFVTEGCIGYPLHKPRSLPTCGRVISPDLQCPDK